MWVAFVFFGEPAYIYFIEGDDLEECKGILSSSYGKRGKIEPGVSEIFENEYLTGLFGLFNITDSVFHGPQTGGTFYYKKSKEEIPKTLRMIDGEFCKVCHEFSPMAVANQSDGTMVCWSCRDSYGWMFK